MENPDGSSAFVSGSSGTVKIAFVTVPAFCWVNRSAQLRDFVLLYRDLAATERNAWAVAHLDGILDRLRMLEQRANVAWESEVQAGVHFPAFRERSEL
jgi:hypothetical protein